MSIPMAFLDPGGIYSGANGQKREIIQIDSGWFTFRIVEEALHGRAIRKKEDVVDLEVLMRDKESVQWGIVAVLALLLGVLPSLIVGLMG